jgi:hypothetical protein
LIARLWCGEMMRGDEDTGMCTVFHLGVIYTENSVHLGCLGGWLWVAL